MYVCARRKLKLQNNRWEKSKKKKKKKLVSINIKGIQLLFGDIILKKERKKLTLSRNTVDIKLFRIFFFLTNLNGFI